MGNFSSKFHLPTKLTFIFIYFIQALCIFCVDSIYVIEKIVLPGPILRFLIICLRKTGKFKTKILKALQAIAM